MILQYSKLTSVLTVFDLILWLSLVFLTFIIVIFTTIKYRSKKEQIEKFQRENVLTWIGFLIFLGTANTLNIVWRFTISNLELAGLVEFISQLFVFFSILIKIINIERGINRSNFYRGYYFSILEIITIIFGIIIYPIIKEVGIIQTIYIIICAAAFIIFPGIFLYLTFKSTGEARIKSFLVFFGAGTIGVGMLLQPQNVEQYAKLYPTYELLMIFFTIICPVLIITGILLVFKSYKDSI